MSTKSHRSRPNHPRTKCTEHVSKKIRPSKRLELYIFQNKILGRFVELRAQSQFPEDGGKGTSANILWNFGTWCVRSLAHALAQTKLLVLQAQNPEVVRESLTTPAAWGSTKKSEKSPKRVKEGSF